MKGSGDPAREHYRRVLILAGRHNHSERLLAAQPDDIALLVPAQHDHFRPRKGRGSPRALVPWPPFRTCLFSLLKKLLQFNIVRVGPRSNPCLFRGFQQGKVRAAHHGEESKHSLLRLRSQLVFVLLQKPGNRIARGSTTTRTPVISELSRFNFSLEINAMELAVTLARQPAELDQSHAFQVRRASNHVRQLLNLLHRLFIAAEGFIRPSLDDQIGKCAANARAKLLVEPLHHGQHADQHQHPDGHSQNADQVQPVPPQVSERNEGLIHLYLIE